MNAEFKGDIFLHKKLYNQFCVEHNFCTSFELSVTKIDSSIITDNVSNKIKGYKYKMFIIKYHQSL